MLGRSAESAHTAADEATLRSNLRRWESHMRDGPAMPAPEVVGLGLAIYGGRGSDSLTGVNRVRECKNADSWLR
jgi:hypothetical protein